MTTHTLGHDHTDRPGPPDRGLWTRYEDLQDREDPPEPLEASAEPDPEPSQAPSASSDTVEIVDGDPVRAGDRSAIGKIHRTCGEMVRPDGNQLACGCGSSVVDH